MSILNLFVKLDEKGRELKLFHQMDQTNLRKAHFFQRIEFV